MGTDVLAPLPAGALERDKATILRTAKGSFTLSAEALEDPYQVARRFAIQHEYLDDLLPPYVPGGQLLNSWRRITTGEKVTGGGRRFYWRVIYWFDVTDTPTGRAILEA